MAASKQRLIFFGSILLALSINAAAQTAQPLPTSSPAATTETTNSQTIEQIAERAAEKTARKIAEKITAKTTDDSEKNRSDDSKQTQTADAKQTNTTTASATPSNTVMPRLMRIGSGALGGNYFVLGELVGGMVSHPLGSLPCGKGGTCGIINLQTQNVTSAGSVANLSQLEKGTVESAFVQSDIAFWAYTGTGLFENKDKMQDLRAIASLYPEALHMLVRKDANIKTVADMAGKRVSVGARKSGTLYGARLVLDAYKLTEDDMETEYLNSSQSLEKLLDNELDAMFFTVGAPAPSFEQLFNDSKDYTLISIGNAERQKIFTKGHYFSPYTISAGTYRNVPAVETISVYALWLTTEKVDEDLVYQLTKALWHDSGKQLFGSSHIGRHIDVEHSLKGIGIPLHNGARKYYNEIGKRF